MGLSGTVLAVAAVLLFPWPWSDPEPQPPSPKPGENGMDTSFGSIESDWHQTFRFHPVDWEARVNLKPDSTPDAAMLMFAFVSESEALDVDFVSLETSAGQPIPFTQDQRQEDTRVPKVFVNASDVPAGEDLVLRGGITLSNNGRYQIGALVIAFDAEWDKALTPAGEVAQLYGYGFVGAGTIDAGSGAPPFEGKGNVMPAGGLVTLLVLVGAALAGAIRTLRGGGQPQPGRSS